MSENTNNVEEIDKDFPKRRNDIDTLRVYALMLVIIFHSAMLFSLYT